MKKFSPNSKMLPSGCCCPVEEETTLHLGFQKGNNHVWRGWSRTMQSMTKLVKLINEQRSCALRLDKECSHSVRELVFKATLES